MSGARSANRAPYWPDRTALRRRRSARRAFWIVAALVLVLPWFGYRQVREWIGPDDVPEAASVEQDAAEVDAGAAGTGGAPTAVAPAAAAPLVAAPPVGAPSAVTARAADGAAEVADEVAAIGRDARAGDGEGAVARLEDLGAQVHRDVLLADRGSAVRREAARRDVAAMPSVQAAGWVDRMTMLLLVPGRGAAQAGVIAEACRRLAAHGDVSGLAVRVQEVAGDRPASVATLGECPRAMSARSANARSDLPFPGTLLRDVRAPATGDGAAESPEAAAERQRRQEESMRILRESTPELPLAPAPPRADPDAG